MFLNLVSWKILAKSFLVNNASEFNSPLRFKIFEFSYLIDPELIIMSLIDPLKLLISPFWLFNTNIKLVPFTWIFWTFATKFFTYPFIS